MRNGEQVDPLAVHDPIEPGTGDPHRSTTPRRRGRRRDSWRWRIGIGAASVVVLWAVAAAVVLVLASEHIHQGQANVQAAKSELSADEVLSGAPVGSLRAAASSLSAAHSLLSSPLLWPIDIVPGANRQLRSVQDLSGAAEQVAQTGVGVVGRSQSLLRLPHTAGPDRVALLRQLAVLASTTHHDLSGIDLGPSGFLLPPIGHERASFLTDLTQVQTTLARTSAGAAAAATILEGPQNYLLVAGNNAEMRAGSGSFLEAGPVTTGNGELTLGSIQPTDSLALPKGAVPVHGDLQARWGFLLPGVDWRNLGLTPQFDVTAPLAASMWKANTGQSVKGVLAIDVQGLQEILSVTGPVATASGTVVSAGNVNQLLLHDQYIGENYGDFATQRVDELSALASAALHAFENRPIGLRTLVDALSNAAQGRHVLVWSANPRTEEVWRDVGVGGNLTPTSLMATVINRGGNKLDYYLTVSSSLRLTTRGQQTVGQVTMTFANHTPPGQSPFIAGPYPGLGTQYGEYVGIATVNLPGDARDVSSPSAGSVVTYGSEGPTVVVGETVDIPAGATKTIKFGFVLPKAHGSLTVVPSARIPPVRWHEGGTTFTDATPHTVSW